VITLEEALLRTAAQARPLGREVIGIDQAGERILAEAITARGQAPRVALSAMDGYAVREVDLADVPARMPIAATIFAGAASPAALERGTCARIFTGAPVPDGADRVVIQEIVRTEDGLAVFEERPSGGRHIRSAGSDFQAGAELLQAGRRLGPREMVVAAAADRDRVCVYLRPRVTVLSTGDELVEPGRALEVEGTIPDSVSFGVAGLVHAWGGQMVRRQRVADVPSALEAAAGAALADAEVVVVTGGASVGERDFARAMFASAGLEEIFTKVAIKPGKPVWMARAGGRYVVGLPGNPTSAMVTARLFLATLLSGLAGRGPAAALAWRDATLATPLGAVGPRETLERARLVDGRVAGFDNSDSGAQAALAKADVLIRRPASAPEAAPGDRVQILDF